MARIVHWLSRRSADEEELSSREVYPKGGENFLFYKHVRVGKSTVDETWKYSSLSQFNSQFFKHQIIDRIATL